MTYKTFIAYSGEDEAYASYIYESLRKIVQIQPYKAEIFPMFGEDFRVRLSKELCESKFMVV